MKKFNLQRLISTIVNFTNTQPEKPSFFYFSVGCFLLALTFILPTGILGWFDGLPWTGKAETITLIIIVPSLLILGSKFLSLRQPILFLFGLFILKVVLFFGSPSSGWQVKVTPNVAKELLGNFIASPQFNYREMLSKMEPEFYKYHPSERDTWSKSLTEIDNNWVKTYETLWNKNASGILQKSWDEKINFPMSWLHIGAYMCCIPENWKLQCPSAHCLEELTPIIEIEGSLTIPEGKKFSLVADGVQEGTFLAISESGENLVLSPAKNLEEAKQKEYQLPKDGKWLITGKFLYGGKNWSLTPVLVEANGEMTKDLGRGILWQNKEDLSSSLNNIKYFTAISFIVDGGTILFLLVWSGWTIFALIQRKIFNLNLTSLSLIAVCACLFLGYFYDYIFKLLGQKDGTTVTHLGISILLTSTVFLFLNYWRNKWQNFQANQVVPSVFILFGPATLLFYAHKWWHLLERWEPMSPLDNWALYQFFAYQIFAKGDWLNAGEGLFLFQPLYRYFVGMYHWLFGQSNFAQHMADVWCVLGATIIIAKIMVKFRISAYIIFISCATYLCINYIGSFRYHIGRGLTDTHGMIFLMLTAWYFILAREGGAHRIFIATVFGIIAFWIRLNHFVAVGCLVLFLYEPMQGLTGGWKGYWNRFKLNWAPLVWFFGGGTLSALLMCFRNKWLGGEFKLSQGWDHKEHTSYSLEPESIYVILSTKVWPSLPNFSGLVIMSGVFIALLSLVSRAKIFLNFPLSLGLYLIGNMGPLIFFTVIGHIPRHSIPILPFAILSLAFLLNNLHEKYKTKTLYD